MVRSVALFLLLIICVTLVFSGCISRLALNYYGPLSVDFSEEVGSIYYDIDFGEWGDTSYDLYVPKNLNPEKECALILFIHGGGFNAGDKADEDAWCKFFASKGYITATVNYSLMVDGNDSHINLMNEQIFACVEAIKEECLSIGYSINQMATSGQSAGGCLAMLYAYSHAQDSPIPVRFVFQQTGPASFHFEDWGGDVSEASFEDIRLSVLSWTGKDITEDMVADGSYRALIDEISPMCLVNESTVPTLCGYSTEDLAVPPAMKFLLFEQFEKHGVIYEFVHYEKSNHMLMRDPDKQKYFIERALEYCDEFFE